MTTRLHNYSQVRAYLEKEHPDWLRAPDPALHQRTSRLLPAESAGSLIRERCDAELRQRPTNTRPSNPALAAVQGQAAQLLRYDVPTYPVSRELLAAALRTELPDDMVFEAILFPVRALVFTLPKRTVRHPTDGDCPSPFYH